MKQDKKFLKWRVQDIAVNVAGATTIPVKAWTPHNTFHMGPFADYSGPKVTVDGQNYILQLFKCIQSQIHFM